MKLQAFQGSSREEEGSLRKLPQEIHRRAGCLEALKWKGCSIVDGSSEDQTDALSDTKIPLFCNTQLIPPSIRSETLDNIFYAISQRHKSGYSFMYLSNQERISHHPNTSLATGKDGPHSPLSILYHLILNSTPLTTTITLNDFNPILQLRHRYNISSRAPARMTIKLHFFFVG